MYSGPFCLERLHRVEEIHLPQLQILFDELALSGKSEPLVLANVQRAVAASCLMIGWIPDEESEFRIIGMGWAGTTYSMSGNKTIIDHVAVAPDWRKRGVGSIIMSALIADAREMGSVRVDLTSQPKRTKAHRLHQSLGFYLRKTIPFRLDL